MMFVIFCIYAAAVLYLTVRLAVRADSFFIKKYHDNSYAVFSSRIMLTGAVMFIFGTALDLLLKIIL